MKRWTNIKNIVSALLFVLISLLIINNSLFIHVHTLSSGEVIAHAHPFSPKAESENPLEKHSHNRNEIQIYNILNSAMFIVMIAFLLGLVIIYIISRNVFFYNLLQPSNNIYDLFNRPPPVVFCK